MKKYKIATTIVYIALIVAFVYSVQYSMPATDDYAWAIEWFSSNRLVEVFKRIGWNYMNWFGQSGVFAVAIQLLLNPFYWFRDAGNSFSICMIIFFLGVYIGIILSIKRIARYLFEITDEKVIEIFTLLTVMLLFTTYYYADVYNWWSGMPGYSFMMVLMLFTLGSMAKYARNHQKNTYISMIITGAIVCTGLMNCVAMGLFYLFLFFIMNRKDGDSFVKKAVPLLIYIVSGLITVLAPGNYKRTGSKNTENPDFIHSIKVTAYDMLMRLADTIKNYPWVIALFIGILIIGVVARADRKNGLLYSTIGAVFTLLAAFGAMYPYVAGERKEIGIELATRVNYMEDYILFIGFSLVVFNLGRWLGQKLQTSIDFKKGIVLALVIFIISLGIAKNMGTLMYFVPYDIYRQRAQIKELYYTWEGIIEEIENSPESDVVVVRENVPWTRFFYPVGIDEGSNFVPEELRDYYGGTNQCTAMWYGKDSVTVYIN